MACHKFSHQTLESAEEHLGNLKADTREHPRRAARLQIYWCHRCVAYHVGHLESSAQFRKRRAEREKARAA